MCLSTRPIKSGGIALNELWRGVLINVSCWHKMSLLKSTGFSFLISNVGLGAHDGAPTLLTQIRCILFGVHTGQAQVQAHAPTYQTYCKRSPVNTQLPQNCSAADFLASPHAHPRTGLIFQPHKKYKLNKLK